MGSEMEKKEVNREVKRAIKRAKLRYKEVERTFAQGNLCTAQQGLKCMASVNSSPGSRKPMQVAGYSPTPLPEGCPDWRKITALTSIGSFPHSNLMAVTSLSALGRWSAL